MTSINVLFLGPARDLAGTDAESVDLADGATVRSLRDILVERHPKLVAGMKSIRFAVNEEFASDETFLTSGDEVALIPPVSGGSGEGILVDLVRDVIDPDHIRDFVTGDVSLGGITTFEGITRSENDAEHGTLSRLDYEAYETMALRKLEELARQAKEKWSASRVAIVHRLGPVPPGEASVIMAVACGHRAESFEACRWLIDTLKKDVPIWKKDIYADGFTHWVNAENK